MQYVKLGKTGIKVSRLCLGMMSYGSKSWKEWVLDEDIARVHVRKAVENGINFLDTADIYSLGVSEEITGRAVKEFFASRHDAVIATKVFNPMGPLPNQRGLSRKHIMRSIDDSLRRLGTDYVDLYQIHRFDPQTPMEESLLALDDVVRAGKALHIGASAMHTWQFCTMIATAKTLGLAQFVSMQDQYNLVYREEEREMIPFCAHEGIAIIPYSPLARGFLAGNRRADRGSGTTRGNSDELAHDAYYRDDDFKIVERVTEVANARGVGNAEIALAWVLSNPTVTAPIVGATRLEHLESALKALTIRLNAEEIARLTETYRPRPILGYR